MPRFDISLNALFEEHLNILKGMQLVEEAELKRVLRLSYKSILPEFTLDEPVGGVQQVNNLLSEKRTVNLQALLRLLSGRLTVDAALRDHLRTERGAVAATEVGHGVASESYELTLEQFNTALESMLADGNKLHGKSHKSKRVWVNQTLKQVIFGAEPNDGVAYQVNLEDARQTIDEDCPLSKALLKEIFESIQSNATKKSIVASQPRAALLPLQSVGEAAGSNTFNVVDILETDVSNETKAQLILQRLFTEAGGSVPSNQKYALVGAFGEAAVVFHSDILKELTHKFKYIDALNNLIVVANHCAPLLPEEKRVTYLAELNKLLVQPLQLSKLLVRFDQLLSPYTTHRMFGAMIDMMKPALHGLGQAIENTMQITDREKKEAGFPTDGDYARIMHHVRLVELKRQLTPIYNTQQVSLMMSLLSYLRWDNPGKPNIETVSGLLLDVLSNPGKALNELLDWEQYKHESLLPQQGYAVRAGEAAAAAVRVSREEGSYFSGFWVAAKKVTGESRLLSCLNKYRQCAEEPHSFDGDQAVTAVINALKEVLLPVAEQYHLDAWNLDKLTSRIKYAPTPAAALGASA